MVAEFRATLPINLEDTVSMQVGPQDASGYLPVLLNGQLAARWDGRDRSGEMVRQGAYHVVTELHGTGDTVVTLAQNVTMVLPDATRQYDLVARPNRVTAGGVVDITLFNQGAPVSRRENVQIFTLAGKNVAQVALENGRGVWSTVGIAPGLYLVAWEGKYPNGSRIRRLVKVLVQR